MSDPKTCKSGKDHAPAKIPSGRVKANPAIFNLECVVVCDRYHDFLAQTLPHNKFLFNKLVVVTSPEDLKTRRICEFHHVECLQTDSLRSRWKEFCKADGINEGLAKLSQSDWVVHMDADIYLPPQTRILLERANLDPAMIYGIDRFNITGYEVWDEFNAMPKLQHECDAWVHMNAFPIGTRVMHRHSGGYVPIGFFQMWHPSTSGVADYPSNHKDAGRTDMLHALRWPRSLRGFIPEVIGYHLESTDAKMSANWNGRTTAHFGPE
jgi:hypothetical protein